MDISILTDVFCRVIHKGLIGSSISSHRWKTTEIKPSQTSIKFTYLSGFPINNFKRLPVLLQRKMFCENELLKSTEINAWANKAIVSVLITVLALTMTHYSLQQAKNYIDSRIT